MKHRLLGIAGLLGALGCSKSDPTIDAAPRPRAGSEEGQAPGGKSVEQAPATASAVRSAAPAPVAGSAPRKLSDLGEVPDWAANTAKLTECAARDAARLAQLGRGDDAEVAEGKADTSALVSSVAGECEKARRALATALNDGAFALYKRKKLDEASRFWAAALNVNPAHIRARYNLACALALKGHADDALWALDGVRRAALSGDARAAIQLAKARSDGDLALLRTMPRFMELAGASSLSQTVLEGPKRDAELSTRAVKLLPGEYHEYHAPGGEAVKYTPALVQVWTWNPNAQTELLVATVIDDPKRIGKPWKEHGYWGIAVLRQDGENLTLLTSRKVGDVAPEVARGPSGTVLYSSDELECGVLRGRLAWTGDKLVVHHEMCIDRSTLAEEPTPRAPATQAVLPAAGTFKACDLAKVDWKNRSHDGTRFKNGVFSDGASATTIEQVLTHDFDGDGKVEALVTLSWVQFGGGGGSWVKAHVYQTGADCLVEELQTLALGISSAKMSIEARDLVCSYDDWNGNAVTEKYRWKDGKLESVSVKRVPH
jgi:hypothetical protein